MLEQLGIAYEVKIASAHRTPEKAVAYARAAVERGLQVIIAAAGGAAHLPGVLAAHTCLPVIGLPIQTGALDGLDALYSMVQMPAGVPVATVTINGAKNAALLAARMIGMANLTVRERLIRYNKDLARQVEAEAARLAELGIAEYLAFRQHQKLKRELGHHD